MSDGKTQPDRLRLATVADAGSLANLRFEWDQPQSVPSATERKGFAALFENWLEAAQPWCACAVAEVGDQLIGMAWLVMHQRVPNPSQFNRATGEIQSVYVRPTHRRLGVGRGLVQLLLDYGEQRDIARFTVDANHSAVQFYQRLGFASSPLMMERLTSAR
ncbi:MAG: GNAT family N-acetyltransferase [Microcella sp.]